MDRSLKAQMKYAGKSGARYLLVLGEDEMQTGRGQLRDLTEWQRDDIAMR